MQFNWFEIIALLVNGPIVRALVNLVTQFGPSWPGWLKQLLAVAAGPGILLLADFLSGLLGFPIDLSELAMILGGLATSAFAMLSYDIKKLKGK